MPGEPEGAVLGGGLVDPVEPPEEWGGWFFTRTARLVERRLPARSYAVAVTTWRPLRTLRVFHRQVALGPRRVATCLRSTLMTTRATLTLSVARAEQCLAPTMPETDERGALSVTRGLTLSLRAAEASDVWALAGGAVSAMIMRPAKSGARGRPMRCGAR